VTASEKAQATPTGTDAAALDIDANVLVGEKAADGAKVQRWFDCPDCGYKPPKGEHWWRRFGWHESPTSSSSVVSRRSRRSSANWSGTTTAKISNTKRLTSRLAAVIP